MNLEEKIQTLIYGQPFNAKAEKGLVHDIMQLVRNRDAYIVLSNHKCDEELKELFDKSY